MGREYAQRRLFVLPHEAAVAVNVGTEYCRELALPDPPPAMAILPPANLCQTTRRADPRALVMRTVLCQTYRQELRRRQNMNQKNAMSAEDNKAILLRL